MTQTEIPFESWFKREYSTDKLCFLCGEELINGKFTREHIFPQWILNKFNLWDKTFNLLNKSIYPYRMSVIPCCNTCNNEYLSKLETEIKDGVEKGYQYFKDNIDPLRIYQWCQLIFYKWLYKETFLKGDIKNPKSEKIVPQYNFDWMKINHLLLRSIDKKITFTNFFPGSIFICHLKTSSDMYDNFDYLDDVSVQSMCIRLNDIGIIVLLADSGLQKQLYEDLHRDILAHQLNPLQFRNLFAKCTYIQYLFNDPFSFQISDITSRSLSITKIEKPNFEGHVYTEWNDNDYLELLGSAVNAEPEQLRDINGKPGSFFYDNNRNWKDRPFEDQGDKE